MIEASLGNIPTTSARRLTSFLPQLVSDMAQRLAGLRPIRLDERLAQCGRHHALLGLRHIGQRIPHPVNPAALPCSTEYPVDRSLQSLMRVGDYQLHTAQTTASQALEED